MDLDSDKLAECAMAMLALTTFKDGPNYRAWKGLDWDLLDDLYERGWICDPKGKAKSVVLTDEGHQMATEALERHFGLGTPPDPPRPQRTPPPTVA